MKVPSAVCMTAVFLTVIAPVMNVYAQAPIASLFLLKNNSMLPNLHKDDIVIVDRYVPFDTLKIGDIIVFRTFGITNTGQHEIIIHRVAQIVNDTNGQSIVRTKGDANNDSIPSLDYPVYRQNYIGKVVYILDTNDSSAILSHLTPAQFYS
jgi:signal peptidase I